MSSMFRSTLRLQSSMRGLACRSRSHPIRSVTQLKALNTEGLCALLDHEHVPEFKPFVEWHKLSGADFAVGIESCEDFRKLGLSEIKARTLFKTVLKWIDDGVPSDFLAQETSGTDVQKQGLVPVISVFAEYKQSKLVYEHYRTIFSNYRTESETAKLLDAAGAENHAAQLYVNILLKQGILDAEDVALYISCVEDALLSVRAAVETNDPFAQLVLALCYEFGVGVKCDIEECVNLLDLAAEQGLSCAQYELGYHYDSESAHFLFAKAAKQGDSFAHFALGEQLEFGDDDVEVDEEQAFFHYRIAADNGNRGAQVKVAKCYENGELGVKKNEVKAQKYWDMFK